MSEPGDIKIHDPSILAVVLPEETHHKEVLALRIIHDGRPLAIPLTREKALRMMNDLLDLLDLIPK